MARATHMYIKTEERHREAARHWLEAHAVVLNDARIQHLADELADFEEHGWSHVSSVRTKLINDLEEVLFGECGEGIVPRRGSQALLERVRELKTRSETTLHCELCARVFPSVLSRTNETVHCRCDGTFVVCVETYPTPSRASCSYCAGTGWVGDGSR